MSPLKKLLQNRLIFNALRYLASVVSIAVVTVILRSLKLDLANQVVVLIYLLPVILSTVIWGLGSGVLAALLAFLTFNYYYIQPFYTFQVHATQDLILLIIFLVVAVVVAQLIGQARRGERLARSREWEATRLYELTSALARLQDTQEIAESLAEKTWETFRCARVEIETPGRDGEPLVTAAVGSDAPQNGVPDFVCSLATARGYEGDMRLWLEHQKFTKEEQRLLEAFTSQGALSLERIRLAKGEKRSRLLEESDRLKSSLLSSVSHELRTPLAAIKASVSSLRSKAVVWDVPERDELLATIEEETDHLNSLVGDLLNMSRIESGVVKPHRTWNSISEIVWGVVGKMRSQLQNHQLIVDIPGDVPLVPTDYIMMEQVFSNLLSNSIKYAPVKTPIKIDARAEHEVLHIRVTNQSPPVPEQHLGRIFDKFHRITEADKITGTGLGLSICKGLVEAHSGRIWASNEMDCFAFHFTLPLTLDGALPDSPREVDSG